MQAALSFQDGSGLEYLKQLGSGSFGVQWLARLVAGSEVGRLVVARRISLAHLDATQVVRVLAAARNYSIVSHPSLAKILGCHKTDTELVLWEEHVIGVPLAKLQELADGRQTSVPIGVSVKLILDVLRAAVALRRTCSNQELLIPNRTVFPDSVIVANFGEALLSGVGVTQELYGCRSIRKHADLVNVLDPFEPIGANSADERFEVFTAGAMLWKLLVMPSLFNNFDNQKTLNLVLHADVLSVEFNERLNLCAPKPIAAVIRRATQREPGLRYQSLQEMINALHGVPPALLGTDVQVRSWLESFAGDFMSDLQLTSGIRRVPSRLQASRATAKAWQTAPHTVAPEPRAPIAARLAPPLLAESCDTSETSAAATTGPHSYPATANTSSSEVPVSRARHVRKAYFIGTLLGITLSLILSYLGTRFKSRLTSTPSAHAYEPISTKLGDSSSSKRASRAEPTVAGQNTLAARPADSQVSAPLQTEASAAQRIGRNYALINPQGSHPSSTGALRTRTKTITRPIHSSRNPWGI